MRILIITAGSQGDVAPFTGLGQRLLTAGHQVTVAAHPGFAALVGGCGLGFRVVPGDPAGLIRERARAGSAARGRAVLEEYVGGLADGVAGAVAGGADVVLTAFGPAALSRAAGEAFGGPVVGAYLAPSFATREFALPNARGAEELGPAGNLAAGQEVLARAEGVFAGAVGRLRARLGLPAEGSSNRSVRPVFHGFSPLVVPRPADWPAGVEVTGYWWPARPDGWRPPAELVDFLQAGPPPVFIGFGSMAVGEGERLGELVAAAVARAGVRAVVQAGWAGLSSGRGDEVLAIGDVPHDWLFPRVAAVVHHAGAGTTAAGLRAGVPAVAVPVMADQPFWASRLHRLGVAPRPVPFHDLTAEALGDAITACLAEPAHRHRAAELARGIAAEDGAAALLAHLGPPGAG
ncbi:glycosyltransferase [Kitasatospora viridis]|uniref:UDP:flavonoid glycosyltransferase YjiC (YdhE family) n=1 Tax=Kitasatospora viridis TaxID=281105 RepID=A0A561T6R9_9ACTN|nr:glycosyltransferase [Kitasatospora viridis]TWF82790.1 UDP:flavonoid glycosyltransferase YjiC (YdhE family) [Kitasatospora viridis]